MPAVPETPATAMPAAAPETLLDVRSLHVAVGARGGGALVEVVSDVSLQIAAGEIVGLVGESGSGKSMTAMSLLSLLPRQARTTGSARLAGKELLGLTQREMRRLRGEEISVIYQEPMTALDPLVPIGEQIAETIRAHRSVSRREAHVRAVSLLERVGIPDPERRAGEYPHELSGGMRQRVLIAIALSCDPSMLIADEPTTALDVTIQAQILELIQAMSREAGMAVLLISHNLGVVAQICRRVMVMYAGELVEEGLIDDVLFDPAHPYTSGLLQAMPLVREGSALPEPIPGRLPSPGATGHGCRFAPRCAHALPRCREQAQPLIEKTGRHGESRRVRCWRADELELPGVGAAAHARTLQ
ncbi:MAG: ABC transporter ATP-binding protein [Lautropia sp.]